MLPILLFTFLFAAAEPGYIQEVQTWRQNYEAGLMGPKGWLSVAGLSWLHEGQNTVGSDGKCDVVLPAGTPAKAGTLTLQRGKVMWNGRELQMESAEKPDVVLFGEVQMTVIKRGDRIGARLRDPNAPTRKNYHGSAWYAIDPKWNVKAKWVAQPKKIPIVNILGMKEEQDSPGYAEFTLLGKTIRLEPIVEGNQLFFIFKDQTSGKATYGAGRYLYTDMPKDGFVRLEFNEAKNPPCAFIAFATCPLPPRQNAMPIALEAGEKKYGSH